MMPTTEHEGPWGSDWSLGLRLWVERAGRAILGPGRLELLEGIARSGSIREAARQMGMSYRRAWLLVQGVNEAAGEPLVVAATGGHHGGGAQLTAGGHRALDAFRALQGRVAQAAAVQLHRLSRAPGVAAVHVAAAVSLEEVVGQLLADYAAYAPSVRVRTVFGASDELAEQILAGASADLFLSADRRHIDVLTAAGLAGPPTVLAGNGLAAVAPAGATVPVRRPQDLVRLAPGRVMLANPSCPLGAYTRAYLEGLGLYGALADRVAHAENARGVVAAVRAGRADVGLVYASDAARADGCHLLFRVRHLPVPIRYTAAVLGQGEPAEAAAALLNFLTSPQATRRFRRCGFEPVAGPPSD
jgi:molybdenum ABC transporter molybdate-binding protein